MKNVLAIAPYAFLPSFSGGQKFIAGFFEHLARHTQLSVISVPENDSSLTGSYQLLPLLKSARSRYTDRSLVRKIRELIVEKKIETIIWEHPYYAWLALKLKKQTGVQTIIHTHNIEYQRFRSMGKWWWPVLRWYEKWCFRNSDKLFFITPEDKKFAINKWKIPSVKCLDLPFGLDLDSMPGDRADCRKEIVSTYNIPQDARILFFNGLLNYKPNLEALELILQQINPRLLALNFNYRVLITGKNLPGKLDSLRSWADKNIIYTGFQSDIGRYYKASDLFLNPVQSGGGIKTKMVESIAYGTTVISTETGAWGIDKDVCGQKLAIVKDNDWNAFSESIVKYAFLPAETPQAYYDKYNWEKIITRVVENLS